MPDELVAAVDEARGNVPRERWIRWRLEEATGGPVGGGVFGESVRAVASAAEQADRSVSVPRVPRVPGVRPAREFVKDPELLRRQERLNGGTGR